MRIPHLLASWAIPTSLLLAGETPPARVPPGPAAPLGQVLEWTSLEGKPYWYRLPRKIDRQKPPCLILMLHGTGLKWGWAFWNYPIAAGTFRGNDIVVAPEGMVPGQGDTFNFIQGPADGRHIAGLIAEFKRAFPVERVYLYGHSQGAFFAYWFAGEHPELVDGIVAHAGNVLDVKHPPIARKRVAIGILHGKADAVVPVDCAYRTEKIYREWGYEKVKLQVVEGLTPESGHWPLPKQVSEMLEWLDSVSASTLAGALDLALAALGKEEPDLDVAIEAAARAGALLKAYRGTEKGAFAERHKAIAALLEGIGKAQAEAVKAPADGGRKEGEYGAWAAHFRAADRALGRLSSWQAAVRTLRSRSQAHDKTIAGLLPQLDRGEKELADGLKAAEACFLGTRYAELLAVLERRAAAVAAAGKTSAAEKLKALVERRKAADEAGLQAAASLAKEAAGKFRKDHPAWFEAPAGD